MTLIPDSGNPLKKGACFKLAGKQPLGLLNHFQAHTHAHMFNSCFLQVSNCRGVVYPNRKAEDMTAYQLPLAIDPASEDHEHGVDAKTSSNCQSYPSSTKT